MTLLKKNKGLAAVILILCVYLIIGLRIYPDYPMTVDEKNQMISGYATWNCIRDTLHLSFLPAAPTTSLLETMHNRFYGQAATFPTVVLEAFFGFSKDVNTVYRIRHLWNFLSFWLGCCCFAYAVQVKRKDWRATAAGLLMWILLPRIFGDVFYNDRDVLSISWLLIFVGCFVFFEKKPGWIRVFPAAFSLAMACNTRMSGYVFWAALLIYGFFTPSSRRKYVFGIVGIAVFFYYLITPVLWKLSPGGISNGISTMTSQRSGEENDAQTLLFMGRVYKENSLPFYYLPVWIFASTPIAITVLFCIGMVKKVFWRKKGFDFLDDFLLILFAVVLLGIMIIRPHFYDCWRHFFFLYVPMIWTASETFTWMIQHRKPLTRYLGILLLGLSFIFSACWIKKAHPYETVYLNSFFRKNAAENFDRDYWRLSTAECLEVLDAKTESDAIYLIDEYASVDKVSMGFLPDIRSRFHPKYYAAQSRPIEYLLANFSNYQGNERTYPYYTSIHVVERDGIKLAELYQRTHNGEISAPEVVRNYSDSTLTDGDFIETMDGSGPEQFEIEFTDLTVLTGLELFSGNNLKRLPKISFEFSRNGSEWDTLNAETISPNGYRFPETTMKYLRINVDCDPGENRSFTEIMFYN